MSGRPLTAGTIAAVLLATAAVILPAEAVEVGPLAAGGPAITRLAVTPNGQLVRGLAADGGIVSLEPAGSAVAEPMVDSAGTGELLAIGCLPGDVTAVVARDGEAWSLRTYRGRPEGPIAGHPPLQDVPLGSSAGSGEHVDIAVSRARGWLAIVGLPPPLPPVVRAAVAGVRVGPFSDRGCPSLAAGVRPVAATVGPFDELILATRRQDGEQAIAYFDAGGRELLRLAAGLDGISGLELGPEDGLLWATGGRPGGPAGLWRLDAGLRDGRQVIIPALVAPLEAPRDLACCSPQAIVVVHGSTPAMALVDPVAPGDSR